MEQLPGKLRLFSAFLGDRKWFAGEKVRPPPTRIGGGHTGGVRVSSLFVCPPPSQLTFVDFLMFDVLDQNRIFAPRCLEPYGNLGSFMERFGVSAGGGAAPIWGGGVGGVVVMCPPPPHRHPSVSHRRWRRWRRT